MIRRFSMLAMLLAALVAMNTAIAAEAEKKECTEKECASKKECSECPIAAAMKNLPQITYQVGTEKTQCRKSAGKLAEKAGSSIIFLVGKSKFDNDADAKLALVEATEEFVSSFAAPHTCSKSGKTSIAGQQTECSKTAAKLASLVSAAKKSVKQSYSVDGEACDCPHAAAALAEKSGKAKLFVVGTEKTSCKVTARLNLARAQYKAMIEALAEASKSEEPESKS